MSKPTIQELRRQLLPDGGKDDDTFKSLLNPEQPSKDGALLDRALGILHRMATEHTGWKSILRRWYYSDEPLRNDAANLVREAGFQMKQPDGTRLVGDRP